MNLATGRCMHVRIAQLSTHGKPHNKAGMEVAFVCSRRLSFAETCSTRSAACSQQPIVRACPISVLQEGAEAKSAAYLNAGINAAWRHCACGVHTQMTASREH